MKIQSKEIDKTLSPTPEDPERRATHRVTLVCRRQSPPLRAIPATTSRMLSRLLITRSLAIAISLPAAPSDAECEARAGPSPWQAGSRKPLFRGTIDRPLHRPIPLIWPCLGGRPTPDRCVLSSSWQPLTPHHPCRPPLDVLVRHNAKWRSGSCRLRAERPQRQPICDDLQTAGISGIGCRSFATNPCCCAYHREPSSSQDPCPCASCLVVTTGIE